MNLVDTVAALAEPCAVLFAYIGWGDRYNGKENIRGNHAWLKKNPLDNSEASAFVSEDDFFYCGVGSGGLGVPVVHVVFVASDPRDNLRRVVGIYGQAEPMPGPGKWMNVRTRYAIWYPIGTRPFVPYWPGKSSQRRWGRRPTGVVHQELELFFEQLVAELKASAVRPPPRRVAPPLPRARRVAPPLPPPRARAGAPAQTGVTDPTSDLDELERRVSQLMTHPLGLPNGELRPRKVLDGSRNTYERLPAVKAWVLRQARGRCERCRCEAPFKRTDGSPYLELHHAIQLAEGGPDTVDNAVALCANCHRLLHHGLDRAQQLEQLYLQVERLVRYASQERSHD